MLVSFMTSAVSCVCYQLEKIKIANIKNAKISDKQKKIKLKLEKKLILTMVSI